MIVRSASRAADMHKRAAISVDNILKAAKETLPPETSSSPQARLGQ
jgi:hypothetical protein